MEHLSSKVCESICPNCGAGQNSIDWNLFVFDEVSYQGGICGACQHCGCNFKEYYTYSDTEWYVKSKKELKALSQDINLQIDGQVFNIHLQGQDGCGRWLKGHVSSSLRKDCSQAGPIDGIEQLLLSLAMNNVNIKTNSFNSALVAVLKKFS